MPDYNLHGLDPRTFQQLVQALAIQELGAGVRVYGDGRDGGRDASFRGKVSYPSDADAWDGHIVIQAKFRQSPSGNTMLEGDWVRNQLWHELKKLVDRGAKEDRPEFYLFVTNVELTAVPKSGSWARMDDLVAEFPALSLKGYDIWDGNKIRRLLDQHRDIAISYGGYITVGDVLSEMQWQARNSVLILSR